MNLWCKQRMAIRSPIQQLKDGDDYANIRCLWFQVYHDADLVIVNTCGFIDSAVQESLEAIGEALNENGKVIVTGCLGAKEDQIREGHQSQENLRLILAKEPLYDGVADAARDVHDRQVADGVLERQSQEDVGFAELGTEDHSPIGWNQVTEKSSLTKLLRKEEEGICI